MEQDIRVESIFQEIQTWENKPINELLGGRPQAQDQSIKRIIVYGPTQVGKTTLIMDLIGIKVERQKDLGKILRGNSAVGTSSTSSAIIYSRWAENCFGLRLGNINGESDEDPVRYDAEGFRQQIEQINLANRNPGSGAKATAAKSDVLYYYLPDDFFAEDATSENLQIVDLPGFGERNENMRKKADEIIAYLSEIVAGAIVVVKSENIQKLESDYKRFIEKHHQNHLAIAVSFALKTSGELREKCKDPEFLNSCKDDRDTAIKISEHYHRLIEAEKYMRFDESVQEQMVFPVEHSAYLAKFFPSLSGAFEESRKLLRERVGRMKNRTSIDACIEELKQRSKRLSDNIEAEKGNIARLKTALIDTQNECKTREEQLKVAQQESECSAKKYKKWQDGLKNIKDAVNRFTSRNLLTENQASNFWNNHCGESESEKSEAMYAWLYSKMEGWLGTKEPAHRTLYPKLMKCVDEVLNYVDYEDMLKKRDKCGFLWMGREFGENSCDYASARAKTIAANIQKSMLTVISRYEQESEGELADEANRTEHQKYNTLKEKCKSEAMKKALEQEIEKSNERIESYKKQIKQNTTTHKKVEKVFVEHYYQKEKELCDRIEKAEVPEIKMALLLVLAAINMTIKPYIEESKND